MLRQAFVQYSKYFKTLAGGKFKAIIEFPSEERIETLYDLLGKNVYPWMWDPDYPKDMVGKFYHEDIQNIIMLKRLGL